MCLHPKYVQVEQVGLGDWTATYSITANNGDMARMLK